MVATGVMRGRLRAAAGICFLFGLGGYFGLRAIGYEGILQDVGRLAFLGAIVLTIAARFTRR